MDLQPEEDEAKAGQDGDGDDEAEIVQRRVLVLPQLPNAPGTQDDHADQDGERSEVQATLGGRYQEGLPKNINILFMVHLSPLDEDQHYTPLLAGKKGVRTYTNGERYSKKPGSFASPGVFTSLVPI